MSTTMLFRFTMLFFVVAGLSACGGGDGGGGASTEPSEPAGTEEPAAGESGEATTETTTETIGEPAPAGTATVRGKVALEGAPPAMPVLQMAADPNCLKIHQGNPPKAETVVTGPNGELANVFVYVSKGLESKRFPPPSGPVKFDQQGCRYDPHVFGIRVNQPLEVHNSDPTLHNVHTLPKNQREVNKPQPKGSDSFVIKFSRPEVMVKVKCEVHPWMNAYAGVVTHPYFAVTGDDGSFAFPEKLPAGTYTITAWHEQYGEQEQEVTVADGEEKEISFTFEEK